MELMEVATFQWELTVKLDDDNITLTGLYGDEDGKKLVIKSLDGKIEDASKLGFELADLVLKEYNNL